MSRATTFPTRPSCLVVQRCSVSSATRARRLLRWASRQPLCTMAVRVWAPALASGAIFLAPTTSVSREGNRTMEHLQAKIAPVPVVTNPWGEREQPIKAGNWPGSTAKYWLQEVEEQGNWVIELEGKAVQSSILFGKIAPLFCDGEFSAVVVSCITYVNASSRAARSWSLN